MTVDAYQTNWDLNIPLSTAAYRAISHASTGLTPNELMFGRKAELPIDFVFSRPKNVRNPNEPVYVAELRERFEAIHQIARESLGKAAIYQKRGFDVNARGSPLDVGTKVWVFTQRKRVGVSEKLIRAWEGPYFIQEVVADRVYKVRRNPGSRLRIVHRDHFIPFQGENDDSDSDQATASGDESDEGPPPQWRLRPPPGSQSPTLNRSDSPPPAPNLTDSQPTLPDSSNNSTRTTSLQNGAANVPEPAAFEEHSEVETGVG